MDPPQPTQSFLGGLFNDLAKLFDLLDEETEEWTCKKLFLIWTHFQYCTEVPRIVDNAPETITYKIKFLIDVPRIVDNASETITYKIKFLIV